MSIETNYNKAAMESDIIGGLREKLGIFNNCISDMATQFDTIKNNWVEGDDGATNVLNNFEQQYLKYKSKLEEGADIIQRFLNEVDAQIDRYASAEANVNSAIG